MVFSIVLFSVAGFDAAAIVGGVAVAAAMVGVVSVAAVVAAMSLLLLPCDRMLLQSKRFFLDFGRAKDK